MVTDDQVLDFGEQLFGKGLAILLDELAHLFVDHRNGQHQMAQELALVGVSDVAVVREFVDFRRVVQQCTTSNLSWLSCG